MVSMYPNSQAMAYTHEDGVFCPYPQASPVFSSECPENHMSGISSLSLTLRRMGFTKFSKIAETAALHDLECHGLTVFATRDEDIPDAFMETCKKLMAINIIKSSCMPKIIPATVLGQRTIAHYPSLNKRCKLRVTVLKDKVGVSCDGKDQVLVQKLDMVDSQNPKVMVHAVNGLIYPECNI